MTNYRVSLFIWDHTMLHATIIMPV